MAMNRPNTEPTIDWDLHESESETEFAELLPSSEENIELQSMFCQPLAFYLAN
jgi:hypothetical protein